MRILYLSCHEILEWDELRMFTGLGHECWSLGAFTNPWGDEGRKRPGIAEMPYDPHWVELALQFDRTALHREQVEGMDVAVVMDGLHSLDWIEGNWATFKAAGTKVIWRSIGQSTPDREDRLAKLRADGLVLVRYSPREATIARYAGADAVIRFAKDPADYAAPWTGSSGEVVNFTQSLEQRGAHVGLHWLLAVTSGFPRRFYGPGNEGIPAVCNGGLVDWAGQRRVLAEARVYAYFGTWPASYTLMLCEALMAGCPVVAPGPGWGNSPHFPDQDGYEAHELIEHGVSGFWSDDVQECRAYIRTLLEDDDVAEHVSKAARDRARELFSVEHIGPQWQALLEEVVV